MMKLPSQSSILLSYLVASKTLASLSKAVEICGQIQKIVGHIIQWSLIFLVPGTGFVKDNFSMDGAWVGGWFQDDSSTLYLLCTLFLLLLQKLHLRSSGIRSQRLGISINITHCMSQPQTQFTNKLQRSCFFSFFFWRSLQANTSFQEYIKPTKTDLPNICLCACSGCSYL